jgi:hypothetical protein
MPEAVLPPKLDRWAAFWNREVKWHLPPGFPLDGVIGGGKGTSFPAFITIISLTMVACFEIDSNRAARSNSSPFCSFRVRRTSGDGACPASARRR